MCPEHEWPSWSFSCSVPWGQRSVLKFLEDGLHLSVFLLLVFSHKFQKHTVLSHRITVVVMERSPVRKREIEEGRLKEWEMGIDRGEGVGELYTQVSCWQVSHRLRFGTVTVIGIICFIQKDETARGAAEALSDSDFLSFAGVQLSCKVSGWREERAKEGRDGNGSQVYTNTAAVRKQTLKEGHWGLKFLHFQSRKQSFVLSRSIWAHLFKYTFLSFFKWRYIQTTQYLRRTPYVYCTQYSDFLELNMLSCMFPFAISVCPLNISILRNALTVES